MVSGWFPLKLSGRIGGYEVWRALAVIVDMIALGDEKVESGSCSYVARLSLSGTD